MEFSSISTVGNSEDTLVLLFFLFSVSTSFPFCVSTTIIHLPLPTLFSPSMYHIFPTQQLFNRRLALVFLCAVGGKRGEWYWRNLHSKFQCSSQWTRPLIVNTRQRHDLNHKKDWDLWSRPSLTLDRWGPGYYGGAWGIGKLSPWPIWRKFLEIQIKIKLETH